MAVLASCIRIFGRRTYKNFNGSTVHPLNHLERLLNNYGNFASEPSREIAFGTDDFGLSTDFFNASNSAYGIMTVQFATWDKQYIPNADAPYWTTEWKKFYSQHGA